MGKPLIKVNNVYFSYTRDDKALKGLNLEIEEGEFVCILGHNGSGKSTLAKLLVGLLEASSGEIYVDDIKISEETIDDIRKRIGIVFQNPDNQFVGITVKDDIAFGLENRQVPKDEMIELIDKYSLKVGMKEFLNRNPEELSGGEKQRVAIAGVLSMNPDIIIFDEAVSMLDPHGVKEVIDIINSLKGTKTILNITHNLNEALLADKVIVINDGKVELVGSPKEVFKEYKKLKEYGLDILDSMKLIDMLDAINFDGIEQVKEALWELSYQK